MKENKKNIDKTIRIFLILTIVAAVCLIGGVPAIVFGATKGWWPLLVLGIVYVVFGFYGTPILWTNYWSLKAQKRVIEAVMEEHLTSVTEIASQLQMRENIVREFIRKSIGNKYIIGYIYDGVTLTPNEKQAPKKKIVRSACPNCGGRLDSTENGYECPYCGSKFEKE